MRNEKFQSQNNTLIAGFWFLVLLGLNVVSALFLVFSTHDLRQVHKSLDETQREQTIELARYSRLLLEKSTLAGLNEIESTALNELDMVYPNVREKSPR